MKLIQPILFLFLAAVTAAFAVLNDVSVSIDLYFSQHVVSLPILLCFILAAGIMLGLFIPLARLMSCHKKMRYLRAESIKMKDELHKLRSLPMRNDNP
ncbi:MAG: LapA family protein [Gammaproteobacteria bacterium]|nr:LapA family protein [Gammaproteobacteria bacterium]